MLAVAVLAAAPVAADEAPSFGDVIGAVVGIRSVVPDDARTAMSLGTEREGSGVVIGGQDLVLTIGYLVLEAESAEVIGSGGEAVPAEIIAYDHDSGFGLLRASKPLGVKPMVLGESAALEEGARAVAVSRGGVRPVVPVGVSSRRPFAGYWEYLLENAIFTSPPHHFYGGAALIDRDGKLLGIGSLLVNDAAAGPDPLPGNMFVPVDLLKPILEDLLKSGKRSGGSQPWLGVTTDDAQGRLLITRVADGGPAETSGLKKGDIIMGVAGKHVDGMTDFFRKVRGLGDAGVEIPLDVLPFGSEDLAINTVKVRSMDRHDWLKLKK